MIIGRFSGTRGLHGTLASCSTPFGAALLLATLIITAASGAQARSAHDLETVQIGDQVFIVDDGRSPQPPQDGVRRRSTDGDVEVLAVVDNAFLQLHGPDAEGRACGLMDAAAAIYSESAAALPEFDTRIHHVDTIVFDSGDPYTVSVSNGEVNPSELLPEFSDWVANNVTVAYDLAILISGFDFQGNVTGLAYTGQACNGALGTSIVEATRTDAFDSATIAHELGHNLGMCHDPPANRPSSCATPPPGASCSGAIMSASSSISNPATLFSECSEADLNEWYTQQQPTCTAPPTVVRSPECTGSTCDALPLFGCRSAGKSVLSLKQDAPGTKHHLKWVWAKGDATDFLDLGNPDTDKGYVACLYDGEGGTAVPADDIRLPSGLEWRSKAPKGWSFKDRDGPSGAAKAILRAGAAGKSKALLLAKGPNLTPAVPGTTTYFEANPEVVLQFVGPTGECWESRFATGDVKKNRPSLFKAVAKP